MKSIFKMCSNVFKTWRDHRTRPLHLEFLLTDACNLNCKGCTHFSPVAPREFLSLDQLYEDAKHLGRVCSGLESVYLIGGEPLLFPDLPKAMEILRECFPNTKIQLFTNGLLLPKMNDEFWETARLNKIEISLTRYPVKFDYDAVEKYCRERGVEVTVFGDRIADSHFLRCGLDTEGRHNPRLSHFKCFNFGCVSVKDGKIYPCSTSCCISNLNKTYGTNFEHKPGDYLNVKDVKSSADILRLRDNPVPFCRYCSSHIERVPYGISGKERSEWID